MGLYYTTVCKYMMTWWPHAAQQWGSPVRAVRCDRSDIDALGEAASFSLLYFRSISIETKEALISNTCRAEVLLLLLVATPRLVARVLVSLSRAPEADIGSCRQLT